MATVPICPRRGGGESDLGKENPIEYCCPSFLTTINKNYYIPPPCLEHQRKRDPYLHGQPKMTVSLSILTIVSLLTSRYRHLPGLQILPLPKSEHEVPYQPRMLSQDVRILCRPHLLLGSSPMSSSWLWAHITETALSEADT